MTFNFGGIITANFISGTTALYLLNEHSLSCTMVPDISKNLGILPTIVASLMTLSDVLAKSPSLTPLLCMRSKLASISQLSSWYGYIGTYILTFLYFLYAMYVYKRCVFAVCTYVHICMYILPSVFTAHFLPIWCNQTKKSLGIPFWWDWENKKPTLLTSWLKIDC